MNFRQSILVGLYLLIMGLAFECVHLYSQCKVYKSRAELAELHLANEKLFQRLIREANLQNENIGGIVHKGTFKSMHDLGPLALTEEELKGMTDWMDTLKDKVEEECKDEPVRD